MDLFFFVSLPNVIYSLVVGLAISLFSAFYIILLVAQARKVIVAQPVSLPVWLNVMYPNWLDRLTLRHIVMAFAWGLGIAILSWIVLVVVLLAILARVHGT
jgi:hypothetical protein